jgi:hypothetical protein
VLLGQSRGIILRLIASIHISALVLALSSTSPINAANITIQPSDAYGRVFVDLAGEIVAGDDKVFEQKVANIHPALPYLVIVALSSPGGDFVPAVNIGEFIHSHGWGTYVPSGTLCTSSCAVIWLAGGDRRSIEGAPGVSIGFHAVYDVGSKKESGAGNALLGSHLARWGLDDTAITCVTVTPPDQIGWLNGVEGPLCHITWEVLAPARYRLMAFWRPPQPPQEQPQPPSRNAKTLRLSLLCVPKTNSSVLRIEVGLSVAYDPNPRIVYFDAWHSTTDGRVYKRSEQYSDRRFEIPNAQVESLWIWEGRRWVQDQYFYMIAQLKRYDAKRYLYREWNKISHELLTDAVCENRPQE